IFHTDAPSGPFDGMIAPTTPIGSFRVYDKDLARQRALDGFRAPPHLACQIPRRRPRMAAGLHITTVRRSPSLRRSREEFSFSTYITWDIAAGQRDAATAARTASRLAGRGVSPSRRRHG